MIGKLSGRVDETGADYAVIDVNGVGYVAFCAGRTLDGLTRGEAATLYIETVVREDMIRLYGFAGRDERDWFKALQTVQGVGAKVALAILSTLAPQALGQALALQDKTAIGRAPGVGKKLAERIVAELKDKAPAAMLSGVPASAVAAVRAPKGAAAEAASALVNLGYGQGEAAQAAARALAELGEGAAFDALFKAALKELAR